MENEIKTFVAYSSQPASIGETIDSAINLLTIPNFYDFVSWKELNNIGKFLIDPICEGIDNCNIFLCELTTLNHNVIFELGYAIAKNKKIFILLDTNIENAKEKFNKLGLFTTIGYTPYTNSNDIKQAFNKFAQQEENNNILDDILSNEFLFSETPSNLLYLKSSINTDSSIKLSRIVDEQKLNVIIDDPAEVEIQSIFWYIRSVLNTNGIVAHLLSLNHQNYELHNAKCSFVCGLAYGLNIPILMLTPEPFNSPLDYKELLHTYPTAVRCKEIINEWFKEHTEKLLEKSQFLKNNKNELKAQNELQRIDLGDSVAENEIVNLPYYFVRTANYEEALKSKHTIFVGRKGTGKTANLFNMANDLDEPLNHICVIKPVAYEIDGIIQIMSDNLKQAEIGYLVESLWKFLIYTELAKSIYNKLKSKPSHTQMTLEEETIIKYVDEHKEIILPEFSTRLDYAVEQLRDVKESSIPIDQKLKISESLHNNIISKLRSILGKYLGKKNKVAILIDNLDKAWRYNTDIELVGKFIFGLLDVGESIIRDFSKEDHWRNPIKVSLIIFLRDDIYNQIAKYALEKDKLPVRTIIWEDKNILLRVIEERMSAIDKNVDIWKKYFCNTVNGISTKEYITGVIMPKPRDIITFVKASLNNAISRKHGRILQDDIIDAEAEYSKHAFYSLLTENNNQIPELEEILIQISGCSEIITDSEISKIIFTSGVKNISTEDVVDVLLKLSFIALEISQNKFEFIYNIDDYSRFKVMARKTKERNGSDDMRYMIHRAFHNYLGISTTKELILI